MRSWDEHDLPAHGARLGQRHRLPHLGQGEPGGDLRGQRAVREQGEHREQIRAGPGPEAGAPPEAPSSDEHAKTDVQARGADESAQALLAAKRWLKRPATQDSTPLPLEEATASAEKINSEVSHGQDEPQENS